MSCEAGKKDMEGLGAEGGGLLAKVPDFTLDTVIQGSL